MINKPKYTIRITVALLFGLFLFNACESVYIEPIVVEIPDDGVSFSEDLVPIFNNSCNFSGCHVSGHPILDLSPANAYTDIFAKGTVDLDNPEQSSLYSKLVETGGTHANRSSITEQQLILAWIREGAKDN